MKKQDNFGIEPLYLIGGYEVHEDGSECVYNVEGLAHSIATECLRQAGHLAFSVSQLRSIRHILEVSRFNLAEVLSELLERRFEEYEIEHIEETGKLGDHVTSYQWLQAIGIISNIPVGEKDDFEMVENWTLLALFNYDDNKEHETEKSWTVSVMDDSDIPEDNNLVSEYCLQVGDRVFGLDHVTINKQYQPVDYSDADTVFNRAFLYAVMCDGSPVNHYGEKEVSCLPSSRTEEYYNRLRYKSLREAFMVAQVLIRKNLDYLEKVSKKDDFLLRPYHQWLNTYLKYRRY